MKIYFVQIFSYFLLCNALVNGFIDKTNIKNDKIRCINECTINNSNMKKGDNKICTDSVFKEKTCFADVTLGCYYGVGSLTSNNKIIEERHIRGCLTRKNRRNTKRDIESKYGDKGHLRLHKKIKNLNFQSDVKFCYTTLCNL